MEDLVKKLGMLKDSLKAVNQPTIPKIPTIKPPPQPSMTPSTASAPKIAIGAGPNSKKDPKKVAQQIKDGSMSTKTQKVMLKTQWSDEDIEKADKLAMDKMYHIHQGPHRITSEPLTVKQINAKHGGIQRLENNGFVLHPHVPTVTPPSNTPKVLKGDRWEDEPSDPSNI